MKHNYILIGWNERSKNLIQLFNKHDPSINITLVDSTLKRKPEDIYNIQFVQGDATNVSVLNEAHIKNTKKLIITSNIHIDEEHSDLFCLQVSLIAKTLNPNIEVFTELLMKKNIDNAERVGANRVLNTNQFLYKLMFHEVFGNQLEKSPLQQLVQQDYKVISTPQYLIGETFRTCYIQLLQKGHLVIGVESHGNILINPRSDSKLHEYHRLIAI
ncbi:NAD-binding protein [Aquibacillus sediminis]|uniref:NAD-binding protein n=1 Tax=Aquibacillus sediminis TaxID=2574734 RepID=UPI0014873427|nr:NAD-binding protein [Aquibacillus sediminis]